MQLTGLTPILNVSDMATSLAWLEAVGWRRCWTWNPARGVEHAVRAESLDSTTFAAVGSGECEIFLCKDGQGSRTGLPRRDEHAETAGVWMSWWLASPADVDAVYALAQQRQIDVTQPPTNEPWGVRECHLRDPDGHTFRVGSALPCH